MTFFYGKYRGTVEENVDTTQTGMIQVKVPDVLGDGIDWARPCMPFAGKNTGFLAIPPKGSNVWVEFEGGRMDRPIWSGGFWNSGQAPAKITPDETMKLVIKTTSAAITFSEKSGADNITIETTSGLKITLGNDEIVVTDGKGKISLKGKTVSVNDGALEVT